MALGQQATECTAALARSDDCASVINASTCYNQNRFRNAQTLQCVDGTDNTDRAKKVRDPPQARGPEPDMLTPFLRLASAVAVLAK